MNLGALIIGLITAIPSAVQAIEPLVARAKESGEWSPEQEDQRREIAEGFYAKHENRPPAPPPASLNAGLQNLGANSK